jgi:ABC-type branched-subunit amino acid transport system substrate-binding protein
MKVGVILPLSGKYEQFGQGTLKGMNCAVGAQGGCTDNAPIQLVTRDDGGNAVDAVKAVEDLVNVEKVQIIVGPLSSTSALAAAKRAQELGVVMISLAQKEGIPEVGENIFRFSLTPNQQIKALLLYVTKKRGKNHFGVFYPNNNYGEVFMNKFKESAPSFGADVAASQAYQDSKNISDDLRNLKFSVGKTSPDAPIGFNAIFIPDSYQSILNIAPQLKLSGLENMLLLGTNAWNDTELANRSGGDLGDVLFLDIYFKGSKNPQVKKFVDEFQAAYGQTPTTLEAMGYDIIKFIGHVASRKKLKNAEDVRNAIVSVSDYEGATGLRAFASNREARLHPFMLTVRNGQIEEVE